MSRNEEAQEPLQTTLLKWKDIVSKVDKNRDGQISRKELQDYIETHLSDSSEDKVNKDIINELTTRFDADRDGNIDELEFTALMNDQAIRKKYPKLHLALSLAFRVALPEREILEAVPKSYSFPYIFAVISIIQLGVFIYYTIDCGDGGIRLAMESPLIYNPDRRYEAWRYISYMLIHSGYTHFVVNIICLLVVGIPLEMMNRPFRPLIVFMAGVIAGSLGTSISDPDVFLAGISGGVFALMAAHISAVILNWKDMLLAPYILSLALGYVSIDLGLAIYQRHFTDAVLKISYAAHVAGAFAGLLVGINVLVNIRNETWENYVKWVCLALYLFLMGGAVTWNLFYPAYFPTSVMTPLKYDSCLYMDSPSNSTTI